MRLTLAASALLAAMLMAAPAVAADTTGNGNVPTVTRLVKIFLDKEAAIASAIRDGDSSVLAGFLTDDFELREGTRAASPIPRADWMRETLARRNPGGAIAGMSVHDFGSVAVASYTQTATDKTVFVVDVWRAVGSDWKLAVRYSSSAGGPRSQPLQRQQQ